MLFAIIAQDKPDSVARRQAIRPDHLSYLKGLGDKLVFAGPFLDTDGNPSGSLVVVEAASLEEGQAIAAADPYAKQSLFATVEVRQWRWGINNPQKRGQ